MMSEEISLREIINIFWNGKKLILITTAVVVLIVAVLNFFILSPTYEATSTVRLGTGIVDQDKGQNLQVYSETLLSDTSLQRLINKLELDTQEHSINTLRENMSLSTADKTNVMKVNFQGEDPALITKIVNLMAFELAARIEITDRSQEIVSDKNVLDIYEDQISVLERELNEAQAQLEQTPEKLSTKQTLADEPYLQSVIGEQLNLSGKELGVIQLESEIINPVYTALKSRISEKSIELAKLLKQRDNLEKRIHDNESRINELENQILLEKLQVQNPERLLNGFNAVFISPAIEPTIPIGPRKIVNIALAAIVGLVLSTIYVFIRHYVRITPETPKP